MTGAGRGIGQAMAHAFARARANLLLTAGAAVCWATHSPSLCTRAVSPLRAAGLREMRNRFAFEGTKVLANLTEGTCHWNGSESWHA